jgi:NAD(P)-dependent dehydrogenase (short-subunit alcohol dehydrogenase family)
MSTVLITGANRGIGLELTRSYIARGDTVIACCRSPEGAVELTRIRDQANARIYIHKLDVTDSASIAGLKASLGPMVIDILINNAGIIGPDSQSIREMDYDGFLETLNVNTLSPLRMLQAFIDSLKASGNPKTITISSSMGSFTSVATDRMAYRTSKAAVNRLMSATAQDLKSDNIIVAVIHPGWVITDMGGPNADITPPRSAAGIVEVIEVLKMGDSGGFFTWDGAKLDW